MGHVIYEYMVETDIGQFTRTSGIDIDLRSFIAGGFPIRRLFFYAPGFPDFPRIELPVYKGMELVNCKLVLPDMECLDRDQKHLPLPERVTHMPFRK